MSVWPGRLARAGSGVLVLGVVGAVAAGSWLLPVPEEEPLAARLVPVPAAPTTLVCPGPIVLPQGDDLADPEFDPAPVDSRDSVTFAAATAPGGPALLEVRPLGADGAASSLRADGAEQPVVVGELDRALVARAEPVGEDLAPVAGSVLSLVTAGDLRGTTAAACQHPASEVWLVGGGTELGATSILLVHNPGATPAEVTVEMWGPAGPVELGSGARRVVPAGGDVSLRLSALAAELSGTVVRVTSAGGQVTAFLQVSELDGFTPGGADLVVPGAAPVERQLLGPLVVRESEVGDPEAATLRLLAPEAEEDVTVRLRFLGESGEVALPGTEDVELLPGEVLDVDLGGLPAGSYGVLVEASAPVLAGARVVRVGRPGEGGGPSPVELTWVPAGATDGERLLAVPGGVTAAAVVTADPGGRTVRGTLRAIDAGGSVLLEEELAVPAGRTVRLVLPEGARSVVLDAEGALVWGVLTGVVRPEGTLLSVLVPPLHPAALEAVSVRDGQRLPQRP